MSGLGTRKESQPGRDLLGAAGGQWYVSGLDYEEAPMENDRLSTLNDDRELRLAALDRAAAWLHAGREATPDDVVALAGRFETYLRGDG